MDTFRSPGAPFADAEHLALLLEKGVIDWNRWRNLDPDIVPQLAGVSFQERDLRVANFCGANLRGADLRRSDLRSARFSRADLTACDLGGALLNGAVLDQARLVGASLILADLREADIRGADFEKARIGWTAFGDNDLSTAKNLEHVLHEGPSTIGLDTIYRSHGKIPREFLRQAGVPEGFLSYMHSLVSSTVEFYSCFISYSSKDSSFSTELHSKLYAQGVRCWKDSEDLKIGDKFQDEIEKAIRLHDKLLVVLSENSVASGWVEREVQAAFEKERRQGTIVLFPVRVDDAVMDCELAWAADIRRTRHIGDFRQWKDHHSFQGSLERLLRDLRSGARALKG